MTLREFQSLHVRLTGKLIEWSYAQGYELTWGQTLRTQLEANANAASGAGISHSLHLIKLAVDFSLFKDGAFLDTKTDYAPLGEYWKSLDPGCRWGGDFGSPDSDHFSIEYLGVK